ncbi:hypothetical protein LINPERHAP1_LOCUS12111, partial [Linum perenne]
MRKGNRSSGVYKVHLFALAALGFRRRWRPYVIIIATTTDDHDRPSECSQSLTST